MANNISAWNAKLAKARVVPWIGANHIVYEYYIPYGKTYEEALDVKSHKKSEAYDNGKRPGEYQPIGDKSHFTFYEMKKMNDNARRVIAMLEVI